jgi:hypothetical protein
MFTPTAASMADNAAAGTPVAAVSVSMSDGSVFAGTLAESPAGTVTISGNNLVLARGLTPADDGSHQWSVSATQNGVTVSGAIRVQVTSSPYPTAITIAPATIADNAPAGTLLATPAVTMSDGSQFSGTLTTSDTDFFAIFGINLVTARALTPADDGRHTTTITAHQSGSSLSVRFSI